MTIGVYSFNIKGYGVYVSQSVNVEKSIKQQYEILNESTHHCLPFQLLYNLYPDKFRCEVVINVDNLESLNMIAYRYRKQFKFVIDSPFKSVMVTDTTISRKYNKYKLLFLEVDKDNLVHIFDVNKNKLGIEVGKAGLLSGYYKTHHKEGITKLNVRRSGNQLAEGEL